MGKTVLITGITGFVGSHLAHRLLDLGFQVFGLYRRRADGSRPRRLTELGIYGEVNLLEADVTNLISLLSSLDKCNPDLIFHLAAHSFVQTSFRFPLEVFDVNCLGTQNLLEAVRLKSLSCKIVFAGSSEEYGLQISSEKHFKLALKRYHVVSPEPDRIPELPINENNPLRPMSPYAISKVYGDFLMRNYYHAYGLNTIVSRAFNHEGSGRGQQFVTSSVVRQCVSLKMGEASAIFVGNVNMFRDWSHVDDIVNGYILLGEKGIPGDVYVQGSMRTNSVLSYVLLTLEHLGYQIERIRTPRGSKIVNNPVEVVSDSRYGVKFERTKIDNLLLDGELEYELGDRGLIIDTNKGRVRVLFDKEKFRPTDVPILLSDTKKIQRIGYKVTKSLQDIIRDQVNYYLNPENRFDVRRSI